MNDRLIYFVRPIGQRGPVKIGCSRLPLLRLQALAAWSPFDLEIVATCPGDLVLERRLHGVFAAQHLRHEWFAVSNELHALVEAVAAGQMIESLIDMTAKIAPFRQIKPRSEQTRRRMSFAQRLRHAFQAIPYHQPDDVVDIMRRWAGWHPHETSTEPTDEELARLEEVIENPRAHGHRYQAPRRRRAA